MKIGSSLLTEKCHLKLKVKLTIVSHKIPDINIYGKLFTMNRTFNSSQHMLIREKKIYFSVEFSISIKY